VLPLSLSSAVFSATARTCGAGLLGSEIAEGGPAADVAISSLKGAGRCWMVLHGLAPPDVHQQEAVGWAAADQGQAGAGAGMAERTLAFHEQVALGPPLRGPCEHPAAPPAGRAVARP